MILFLLLISAPESQDPAWLMRESLSLAGKPAAKWQPIVAALSSLPVTSPSKALFQIMSRTPGAPVDVRCYAAYLAMRAGGALDASCDPDLGPVVALQAAADGAGGKDRIPFILSSAKSTSARVRLFAGRAAVFALPDARAATLVRSILRTGDSVAVSLVADAFSHPPKPWATELANAAERDGIDDRAMRLIQEALGDAYTIDVQPASLPARIPTVTTHTAAVHHIIDRDGRIAPYTPSLVAIAATR